MRNDVDALSTLVRNFTVPAQIDESHFGALLEEEKHARISLNKEVEALSSAVQHLRGQNLIELMNQERQARDAYEGRVNALLERERLDHSRNLATLRSDVDAMSSEMKTPQGPTKFDEMRINVLLDQERPARLSLQSSLQSEIEALSVAVKDLTEEVS